MRAAIFSARATSTSATTTRCTLASEALGERAARSRARHRSPPRTGPSSSIGHLVGLDPQDFEHHTADLGEEVAGAALAPLREAELGARDVAAARRACACSRLRVPTATAQIAARSLFRIWTCRLSVEPAITPPRSTPRKSTTLSIVKSPLASCAGDGTSSGGGADDRAHRPPGGNIEHLGEERLHRLGIRREDLDVVDCPHLRSLSASRDTRLAAVRSWRATCSLRSLVAACRLAPRALVNW